MPSVGGASLLGMPVEIGLQVVEYLPPKTRAKFAQVSHTCHAWVEHWPNLVSGDVPLRPKESRRAFWVRDFQSQSHYAQKRLRKAMDETRNAADFASPLYDADTRLFASSVYRSEEYGFHLIYQHVSDKWRTGFAGPWFYLPKGARVAGQLNGTDRRVSEMQACRDGRLIPYSPSGQLPSDAYVVRIERTGGGGIRVETPDGKRSVMPCLNRAQSDAVLRTMTFKPIPSNYEPMCLARLDDGRFLYLDTPTTGFTGSRRAFFGESGAMQLSNDLYPQSGHDISRCTLVRTDFGDLSAAPAQITDPDHARLWALSRSDFETRDGVRHAVTFENGASIRALLPQLGIDIDRGNTQQLVPSTFETSEPASQP